MPQGLCLAYPTLNLTFSSSPSRALHLSDPLLSLGIMRCAVDAYLADRKSTCYRSSRLLFSHQTLSSVFLAPPRSALPWPRFARAGISEGATNMFMSPAIAPDDLLRKFPPTNVMCGGMDPLLDDAVDFHGRLVRVGVPASLKIYRTMPHGFLSMDVIFRDALRANKTICWWVNKMFAAQRD